jgi:hypothetical protein
MSAASSYATVGVTKRRERSAPWRMVVLMDLRLWSKVTVEFL